jgi:hypothetical protein
MARAEAVQRDLQRRSTAYDRDGERSGWRGVRSPCKAWSDGGCTLAAAERLDGLLAALGLRLTDSDDAGEPLARRPHHTEPMRSATSCWQCGIA